MKVEEKFNEATRLRPEGDRAVDAQLVTIDLPAFVEQIRNEKSWQGNDRNAITVFKTNGLRIVLIALHKDAEMIEHKADGIISLQLLEGEILCRDNEQSFNLGEGQMLALHEGVRHSIVAIEESIMLLTLTTTLLAN